MRFEISLRIIGVLIWVIDYKEVVIKDLLVADSEVNIKISINEFYKLSIYQSEYSNNSPRHRLIISGDFSVICKIDLVLGVNKGKFSDYSKKLPAFWCFFSR